MTAAEMKGYRFVTVRKGGYNPEDVDDFLENAIRQMEALEAAKEDAENKMYVLAQKVEEYRGLEDTLKTALINAQRMGETVVHEAKQKADAMIREASGKSQMMKEQAEQDIAAEYDTLEKLREEVGHFKSTVLNIYKQHIEALSALDTPLEQVDNYLEENQELAAGAAQAEPVVAEDTAAVTFSESFEESYEPVPQNFTPLVDMVAEKEEGEAEWVQQPNTETELEAGVLAADEHPTASLFDGYQLEDMEEEKQ